MAARPELDGYAPDTVSGHDGGSGGVVDLALIYGRNNLLLNPDFGFVPGSVYATIEDGLDRMADTCQDVWCAGAVGETLTYRRLDSIAE